jgi:hypothetical protein
MVPRGPVLCSLKGICPRSSGRNRAFSDTIYTVLVSQNPCIRARESGCNGRLNIPIHDTTVDLTDTVPVNTRSISSSQKYYPEM